jgi:hypothetical protein
MRKTRRSMGLNAEFYVINNDTPTDEQLAEFHIGEEYTRAICYFTQSMCVLDERSNGLKAPQ